MQMKWKIIVLNSNDVNICVVYVWIHTIKKNRKLLLIGVTVSRLVGHGTKKMKYMA